VYWASGKKEKAVRVQEPLWAPTSMMCLGRKPKPLIAVKNQFRRSSAKATLGGIGPVRTRRKPNIPNVDWVSRLINLIPRAKVCLLMS